MNVKRIKLKDVYKNRTNKMMIKVGDKRIKKQISDSIKENGRERFKFFHLSFIVFK